MSKPLVSVIIPCYNEEKNIKRLLLSIQNQTYKHIEAIVVDDQSTDNTVGIAKKYTRKVFTQKHAERSKQRNYGARQAKGEFLFFLDADMKLGNGVIKECVDKCLKDNKVGGVSVPETSVAKTYWERVKAFERAFYNESGDSTTDAERFFSKAAFNKVGGYDQTITGPEDWDLPERIKKAGFKMERTISRIYHYERVPSPWKLAQKKYYYALTSHRYLKKHDIPVISPKTIYFLRPVFYRNWKKLLSNLELTAGLITMFTFELLGGGLGFLTGKFRKL